MGEAIQTVARNASLQDLAELLRQQQDLKLDAIVPATAIRSQGGLLFVKGMSVTEDELVLRPTAIFDGQVAERLGIPTDYLRSLRNGKVSKDGKSNKPPRLDLYDANVNGWLHGNADIEPGTDVAFAGHRWAGPDSRSFLLRSFSDPDGGEGIARALLSDRYAIVDNLDVLMAALAGVKASGVETTVDRTDLTETRMTVHFASPAVAEVAPDLLRGYNSPVPGWGDLERVRKVAEREGLKYEPGSEPVLFAGFCLTNGETGGGSFTIVPELTVEICGNKLRITIDAMRKVHLGGQQDEGIVRYSQDTQRKRLELVTAEARDAVATFLDAEYVRAKIAELSEKAGTPVTDVPKAVEMVANKLRFTEEQQSLILDHFIRGGQLTAGGMMQAVTSAAQVVDDPDTAFEMENVAVEAMQFLAANAKAVAKA